MPIDPLASRLPTPAQDLFADYVLGTERGTPVDFEGMCAAHPDLAGELRQLLARHLERAQLQQAAQAGPLPLDARSASIVQALRTRGANSERYRVICEIGKGGQGTVYEAEDVLLQRRVALKVISDRSRARELLPLFHREMRMTARLSHPGVGGVLDAGVDNEGRAFFAMPLIRGENLTDVFRRVAGGDPEWTLPRALGLLVRACETIAFAHGRGVIHRDIKPDNIMVGEFGEVYVMDWGLAKLADSTDPGPSAAEPARAPEATDALPVFTQLTADGGAVGTVSFMSPEQMRGAQLDARTDVYALGSSLYMLLTGTRPYVPVGGRASTNEIVTAALAGPPAPVDSLNRSIPPELVSICDKAMARDRAQRYPTAQALADDLRRYLEDRVVLAHRTGAWIEFKKWVRRNPGLSVTIGALVLAVVGGLTATVWLQARSRERAQLLADAKLVPYLIEQEASLWPPYPAEIPRFEGWLADARAALSRGPAVDRRCVALAESGHRDAAHPDVAPAFDDPQAAREYALMGDLQRSLPQLPEVMARVSERLEFARTIEARSVTGPEARERWEAARNAIRSSPKYGGLDLEPQLGLLPIGADPESGLWEFWHVQTGTCPERETGSGRLHPSAEMGVVLVLLPGGTTSVGSKPPETEDSPPAPYTYGTRDPDEDFFEGVHLDPYLVSKYETTRAQWKRIMGLQANSVGDSTVEDRRMPATALSRAEAFEFARRTNLQLPSEAQWEHACRAGTTGMFSFASLSDLGQYVNSADAALLREEPEANANGDFDDGFPRLSPVGALRPNGFGLHDMHGNVWEWCRDDYVTGGSVVPRRGDGLRVWSGGVSDGVIRGGSWFSAPPQCTSSNRMKYNVPNVDGDLGVRFVRRVERSHT